ncbi:Uncharacterised protein [Mycobacteroides abscessus subsp. massiliense]|uniref:hypothetical protein n=1 Tax=Mycobacteroides abscessus TaxID=36809 RepID=UPI0009A8D29C|nr:hypothetical protein [Mycobacteroides abscessus]SKY04087.1 Uncharacterised protein [Mycobacteroides abscessus subsp. massiliense]SKZ06271.1 Uncharacterised protein [Mycobacteroides abscessus subsp. massiliense]
MIRRGSLSAKVYRAVHSRDEHGDPIDEHGNVIRLEGDDGCIGTVYGLIMGGQAPFSSLDRQESSNTTGQIGIPNKNAIKVKFGDRLVINEMKYKVTSTGMWDYPQLMTGTPPEYHWVTVDATIN